MLFHCKLLAYSSLGYSFRVLYTLRNHNFRLRPNISNWVRGIKTNDMARVLCTNRYILVSVTATFGICLGGPTWYTYPSSERTSLLPITICIRIATSGGQKQPALIVYPMVTFILRSMLSSAVIHNMREQASLYEQIVGRNLIRCPHSFPFAIWASSCALFIVYY